MVIEGIGKILDKYDLFIVDIWGVVYNEGVSAFPGVIPLLERIKAADKKLVFLSNNPTLNNTIYETLGRLGIGRDLYNAAHTSGIETNMLFKENGMPGIGPKCFVMYDSRGLLDGVTNVVRVETPEEADFVLASGIPVRDDLEYYAPTLEKMLKLNLTMICPNPDMFVVIDGGSKLFCQGAIACVYEKMGGKVIYIGKPYPQVYQRVFTMFPDVARARTIAIGDNMRTDILGANSAGIDSVFIANGMYASDIHDENGRLNEEKLEELRQKCEANPTYVCEWFAY